MGGGDLARRPLKSAKGMSCCGRCLSGAVALLLVATMSFVIMAVYPKKVVRRNSNSELQKDPFPAFINLTVNQRIRINCS